MIDEFRRSRRRKVADTVLVVDTMLDSVAGRLGNLSETGMLMMASTPLVEDALYQFRFNLNDARGRETPIEVGAHLLWQDDANSAGPDLDRLPLHHGAGGTDAGVAQLDRRAGRPVRIEGRRRLSRPLENDRLRHVQGESLGIVDANPAQHGHGGSSATHSAITSSPRWCPMSATARTIARLIGSVAMSRMKLPSILMTSIGRFFR